MLPKTQMDPRFPSAIHVVGAATTFQESYPYLRGLAYTSSELRYRTQRENAYRKF